MDDCLDSHEQDVNKYVNNRYLLCDMSWEEWSIYFDNFTEE